MLASLQDAEEAVQEALLRAWRYRDRLKEGAPLRPWLYRVATNVCLDAIARDERRAVLAAKAAEDDDWAGKPDEVVWLRPVPNSVLEPPTPPEKTPEAMTLARETIEIAFMTVIQLLTPQQRAVLILCDVLDWSAKGAADLLELSVPAVNKSAGARRPLERLTSGRQSHNLSFIQTGKRSLSDSDHSASEWTRGPVALNSTVQKLARKASRHACDSIAHRISHREFSTACSRSICSFQGSPSKFKPLSSIFALRGLSAGPRRRCVSPPQ